MANTDTIAALVGGTGRGQIAVANLTATTETLLLVTTDAGTATATLTVPAGAGTNLVGSGSAIEFNQNSAISSQSYGRKNSVFTEPPFFSTNTFDAGRPFKLRLVGTVQVAAATVATATNSVSVAIYNGSAITATYKVATITGIAANTSTTAVKNASFNLEATVGWDSVSQLLSGTYQGVAANVLTTQVALSNAVSVTSAANLVFSPTVAFAQAAGGSVTVSEFSVSQV